MHVVREDGDAASSSGPTTRSATRELHGLTRTLVANMVIGVTTGYRKGLEITGVGYRAQLVGNKLQLNLGYSHPIEIDPPGGHQLRGREPDPAGRRRHRQGARRPGRRHASAPPASPSRTRARASATPASSSAARPARPARSAARSEHGHSQALRRCAPEAPRPDPPDPAGRRRAAAPGRVPQPQPHLRPGHRRQRRPDAGRRLVARDGAARLEGHQDGARPRSVGRLRRRARQGGRRRARRLRSRRLPLPRPRSSAGRRRPRSRLDF